MSKPIRVLQLIARLNVGGPATQVVALAGGLDPDRFEVQVATGAVDETEADHLELRAPDTEVVVVPGLRRSMRGGADARALAGVRQLVQRFRPDIVHTHTAKAGALGRMAARTVGAATVHTYHGHLLHGYFPPRLARGVVLTERALARRTDGLVAVGHRVRDELLDAGIGRPERFTVIPPGVEVPTATDPAAARQELDLPDDAVVLAFVGRLTQIKRPDRLVDAFARLHADHPEAVLLLAGDGEQRATLQRRAQRERLPVRFLGWRADVGRLYSAADLALLASDNEGMPVSLIEAAMCGVPAVATDVGSVGEVVADARTGRVVAPTEEALAAAVSELLEAPEQREEMGRRAREHAEATFGIEQLVEATSAVYDRALAARAGR